MSELDTTEFTLADFVDVERLQALQDHFAALTGMATSIRDANGNPITRPAEKPAFCELVQSTSSGFAACQTSHSEAAELVRTCDRPCQSQCHAGLSQFVAPILLEDRHLGTIIVGDRPAQALTGEGLVTLAESHGLDCGELKDAAARLAPWADESMRSATDFIQELANTIARLAYNAYQLRCRINDLTAVHDIASKLAGHVSIQEILDAATRQLVDTMVLRAAGIRLLDEETGVLRIASTCNLSDRYLDKKSILATESAIDQEVLSGKSVYIRDLRTDSRNYYPEKAREEGLASVLVTPIKFNNKPIGVLRAYMDRVYEFSQFDEALMEAISSQVAAAIVNARLRQDAQDAERLDRQVKLAADVQGRMFPASVPTHPHFRFGCIHEPSFDLGGDFYDFLELPDGEIGMVIADVVGKGVPASLMMANARAALRSHAKRVSDIGELMKEVNLRLCEDTLISEFVTAFYGVLSADGRRLRYCNAGHEPLLLLRQGEIRRLDAGGLVLGLDPAAEYEWTEEALEPNDLLTLVTDGMVEAMNYDEEEYGRDRLHKSIQLHGNMAPDMPVNLVAQQLLWDVRRFAGLAKMSDDITLVVTRVV
ncbi:MAG: SpoIIE family protein phosphatase [Phycisphaerales bacterium]|nr:SpoIIE family protein phosphatase [Phycisphaerales bacterium]